MQDLIEGARPRIAQLCRQYHVRRLDVFGSTARGISTQSKATSIFSSSSSPVIPWRAWKATSASKKRSKRCSRARSISSPPADSRTPTCGEASRRGAAMSLPRDPKAFLWDAREAARAALRFAAIEPLGTISATSCCVRRSNGNCRSLARHWRSYRVRMRKRQSGSRTFGKLSPSATSSSTATLPLTTRMSGKSSASTCRR